MPPFSIIQSEKISDIWTRCWECWRALRNNDNQCTIKSGTLEFLQFLNHYIMVHTVKSFHTVDEKYTH